MLDPVRAADGIVYERANIAAYRSPAYIARDGGQAAATRLISESALKREINAWRAAQAAKASNTADKRIDVCIHDFGEIAGISMRRQPTVTCGDGKPSHPVVSHVIPGSSAARAGVRPGDQLVGVDSAPLPVDVQGPELVAIVASAGRPVYLTLARSPSLAPAAGAGIRIEEGEHIIL